MRKILLVLAFSILLSTDAFAIEQQRAMNWCWASCVQDVLSQAGVFHSQTEVSARLTGWPQDRPANINELVVLTRSYGLRSWQAGRPGNPQELYNTLATGWKLIAFVRPSNGPVGHYIVLEGIDRFGNIIVSDPATGSTNSILLNGLYYGWRWSDSVVVGR